MSNLTNNPVLLPHQKIILKSFFQSPLGKKFFLTGGTALSAFYLQHRLSQDLDFFTLNEFDSFLLSIIIEEIALKTRSHISTKLKTPKYQEIYMQNLKEKWTQRLDFVHEQPVRFGKIKEIDNINIDSLENIATNKILSIYGRLEVKDYIDLYMILEKTDLDFNKLFELAKKKDTGLHEFYFANIITKVADFTVFPHMLVHIDKKKFQDTFTRLSKKLLLISKPK